MKAHTNNFKTHIALAGRELDDRISYIINGQSITLTSDDLNSIVPSYEGGILKSVMKEIDIDSNISIPKNTIINYKMGVKVDSSYEYIDFGNYIVFSCDKSEDTNSYNIIAYDKMLYSMKDYEELDISYPISVRDYVKAVCNKIGLTFANENDIFANYNKNIDRELYLGLNYKYRDVFDELATTTASTICLNDNDEVEIRYITETNDVIDEDYFKDTNVQFGEKYGPLNSVVLSRSAESDNIFLRDEDSVSRNGLCEIKIVDNQIMNWNNRDEFLPEILEKLNGLEYYVNDFSSRGICYYDLCDRYTAKIGEKNYSCIMLNDEVCRRDGLEENIFTEPLAESVTDYSKADKTDRRINQATLIVDKQNQVIEGLIKTVGDVKKNAELFRVDLEINNIVISVNNSNLPHENASYDINYDVFLMGQKITLQPTTKDVHSGIAVTTSDDYIRFTINKDIPIPALDNRFIFKFTYTDQENNIYELTKTIFVCLALQGSKGKETAVQSEEPPEDTTVMWLDTTTNQLKRWNGEEWEVINDFTSELDNINSSINNLSSSMQNQLNDLNTKISQVLTELESKYTQTNNAFDWRINTLMSEINSKTGELERQVLEQSEYMRFESGTGLVIGKSTSPYTLVSKEDGIEIRYNNIPISFWNGDTFKVTRLMLGNFAFTPRDNGSLDFGKVVN